METETITFDVAVANFLDAVDKNILEPQNNAKWRASHGKPYTVLRAEDTPKYVKITATHGGQDSVWAFIVKEDNETRTLGKQRRGDILKPASWKMPARHARGNIFDPGESGCCNVSLWTGPSYMYNL